MAIPVISVAQMRQWEAASWAAGKREGDVIQQVGRAAARRLCALTRAGDAVWILAGKGHNGDDARAMIDYLDQREIILTDVANPKEALARFPKNATWVVDGLFGIGLDRPLAAEWGELFEAIERAHVSVFALDVPSGLDAATGTAGGPVLKAAITMTVGAPKAGLLRAPQITGRLEVAADVGLVNCPFSAELNWTLPLDFLGWPPSRATETNKGSFGHAAIIAGSVGYHGAAVLAARGALRAQPGLVTVFPQEQAYLPVAAQFQAAMVHPWKAGAPLPKTCSAILAGPGLAGEQSRQLKDEIVDFWRNSPLAMVIDASALDWLPRDVALPGAPRIITPHPGEAGRLLGCPAAEVQKDRVSALRQISRQHGDCWVVLKGNHTLVGRSTGALFINSSGNPFLAQGGSGDLLSGYLTGLLAQPAWHDEPLLAARFAVWQHGAAADFLAERHLNWTLDELEQTLGAIGVRSHFS